MIKNKKGFILSGMMVFGLALLLILVALLIWFSFRIDEIVSAVGPFFTFLAEKWWLFATLIGLILFYKEIAGVLRFILSKLGVKI